jgi:hypothetical protein
MICLDAGTANGVRATRSLPSSAHALHKNRRHLLWHIAAIHVSFVGNVCIRQIQAHAIPTQYPHFQRLMVTGKHGVGSIITACIAVFTRRALTGGFRIITTALDDLCGCTSGARDAIWPA